MLNRAYLIYPYFENPKMLELQIENWNRLDDELSSAVQIVIVDDHSTQYPALPILLNLNIQFSLFRIMEPGIWGMHEARNIGAMASVSKEDAPTWLLMSDIDLMMTPENLRTLLSKNLDFGKHYTFERRMAPDFRERNYHCNSYFLNHRAYYAINGYDVDFTGTFNGGYGGDREFSRQLSAVTPREHLTDVFLLGYERDEVEDAHTIQWNREEWKKKFREVYERKRSQGKLKSINPIRRKFEQLL